MEARDADFTLTNTSLVTTGGFGTETDTLSGIEQAELTGGAGVNTIDAHLFSLGSVTLSTGGGLDTLKGGAGNDEFRIDVDGLTAGQKVNVDVGGGTLNVIRIVKSGATITGADLNWVNLTDPLGTADYTISRPNPYGGYTGDGSYDITTDVINPGKNITIEAATITMHGHLLSTDAAGGAGNITLRGKHITIDQGAQLSAMDTLGGVGAKNGAIKIDALDGAKFSGLGFANVDLVNTDVTIDDAKINGGAVEISAVSDSQHFLMPSDYTDSAFGQSIFGQKFASLLDSLARLVSGLAVDVAVSVAKSVAHVTIDGGATITADTLTVESDAKTLVYDQPISILLRVSAAVGVTNSDAEVTIGDAHLSTTGDMTLHAVADHIVRVFSDIAGNSTPVKGFAFSVGVAVSVLDSTAMVDVQDPAQLTVGGDLLVQSDTTDRSLTRVRVASGADGDLAASVTVSVANTNSYAYLDGNAQVAGNITVTAKETRSAVEVKKAYVLPGTTGGVLADARQGSNSTGDVLDDLKASEPGFIFGGLNKGNTGGKNTGLDPLANWLKSKVGLSTDVPPIKQRTALQGAVSVAFADETNTTTARIGDGDSTHSTVNASGTISVNSTIDNRPKLSAQSSAIGAGDTTDVKGLTKVQGTAKVGISLAIGVGLFTNHADATISGNAIVNAKNAISVNAATVNQIDPLKLWGANLVSPFLDKNTTAKYNSDTFVPPVSLKAGDTVEVGDNNPNTDQRGKVYQYIGPDGATLKPTTDFSDTTKWTEINLKLNAVKNEVSQLTGYLNGNLGLSSNLADFWNQAFAVGQSKASIAGAFTVAVMDHSANAIIKDGASINQDADLIDGYRTGNQTVTVNAANTIDAISLGGNVQTLGVDKLGFKTTADARTWTKTDAKYNPLGGGGESKGAVGVNVMVFTYDANAYAKIEDNVHLFGDSLAVTTKNNVLGVTFGASGGELTDFTFNGVVLVEAVNSSSVAQIDNRADVDVGNKEVTQTDSDGNIIHRGVSALVEALDNSNLVTIAGTYASSQKVGIGASVGATTVTRDTEALIGNRAGTVDTLVGGHFTAGGSLLIDTSNTGFQGAFSVAGAKASAPSDKQVKTSGAVAVGLAINLLHDTSLAYIDTATVSATGDITLRALDKPVLEAFTIGGSLARGDQNSIALSGALSLNLVDNNIGAYITGSSGARFVHAGGTLTLDASDLGTGVFSQAGAVSIAWGNGSLSGEGSRSLSIGASVALNFVGGDTGYFVRSYIDGSTVTANDVSVTAVSQADMHALAVGGSFSKASLSATSSLAGAVAGAYAANTMQANVEAYLDHDDITTTKVGGNGGDVSVSASDLTKLLRADAFGVAVAFAQSGSSGSAGALSIGVGIARNKVSNKDKASVRNSKVDAAGKLSVYASSAPNVATLAIGVAGSAATGTGGSAGAVAGAGGAATNSIDNEVEAFIQDDGTDVLRTISAGNGVALTAIDSSNIYADAGGFAFSLANSGSDVVGGRLRRRGRGREQYRPGLGGSRLRVHRPCVRHRDRRRHRARGEVHGEHQRPVHRRVPGPVARTKDQRRSGGFGRLLVQRNQGRGRG